MHNRDEIKRRVLESTDLIDLIGSHVAIKPRGREFVGICPFHEDSNPSMYVSPSKQIYKCFACGAGGDAYNFVMAYHKMTFPEAMKHLADRAGIELPKFGGSADSQERGKRERILEANKFAAAFFTRYLHDDRHGAAVRNYVAGRGISEEMVKRFDMGYSPDSWDALSNEVNRRGLDRQAFEMAGLISRRKSGDGCYDRFRHRLMFPICDSIGRIIAFGGRVLAGGTIEDESDAKYLNSPEQEAFNKSATLFGLHLAQRPIIDGSTAVIVEGYTDVIAAHQAGADNVVATLGTALTRDHAKLLKRFADRVVLIFDADEAGQKAADRALEVFFNEPLDVEIAIVPEGKDPADLFATEGGLTKWNNAIDQAVDAMSFQFARIGRAYADTPTMAGRQRLVDDYLRTLVRLGLGSLDRERYGLVFARLGQLLGMAPGTVQDAIKRLGPLPQTPQNATSDKPPAREDRQTAATLAERQLLGCLLCRPGFLHANLEDGRPVEEWVCGDDFHHSIHRQMWDEMLDWSASIEEAELAELKPGPGHLREMFDTDQALGAAVDMQLEMDRLTGLDDLKLTEQLVSSVKALARMRTQAQYERDRQQMVNETQEERKGTIESDADRLDFVRAHITANPSAARTPRPIR